MRDEADLSQDPTSPSVLKRKRDERWYNSSERRADCDLYGGAASRPAAAGLDLKRTCELYREAYRSAEFIGAATQLAMSYKLTIALALNAEIDDARQELENADRRYGETNRESDKRRIELLRRVARAAVTLAADGGATDGRQQLRKILDDLLSLNPSASAKDRCEVQELYLFCAELLLASAMRDAEPTPAEGDLKYLTSALWRVLGSFRGLQDESALQAALLPYLRRYFEISVEAAIADPAQASQFVLSSRLEENPADDSRALLFFFQDCYVAQPHSIAALQSDEDQWELFELANLTRAQILEKRSDSPLPENLIQRVKQLQSDSHPIRISWSDEKCWVDRSQAIAKQHWPPAWTVALGVEPGHAN